ncbi:MAG: translation initiation factor IF-5A [Candidatus Pacearchaeota archaeon]
MVLKVVSATDLRVGSNIYYEGEACVIKSIETSKTGKHGASKCRMEALGLVSGKKKVIVCPGHERFEVPLIEKKKAQVLSVNGDNASVMDSDSFETLEIPISEEIKDQVKEGANVEYWDIEGTKILKRVF